jgi:hypothetical protein
MNNNVFDKLMAFLNNLEQKGINYTLAHHRDEALMVLVALPGERWEIEFLSDGSVGIERFISSGDIHGKDILGELFARYAEQEVDNGVKLKIKI